MKKGLALIISLFFLVSAVTAQEKYFYVASGYEGLVIFKMNDDKSIVPINVFKSGENILDLFVSKNTIFTAEGVAGMRILDITDKTNIKELAVFPCEDYCEGV
nr:hypothetical protein [Petrotogaceae bacterium]